MIVMMSSPEGSSSQSNVRRVKDVKWPTRLYTRPVSLLLLGGTFCKIISWIRNEHVKPPCFFSFSLISGRHFMPRSNFLLPSISKGQQDRPYDSMPKAWNRARSFCHISCHRRIDAQNYLLYQPLSNRATFREPRMTSLPLVTAP